MILNCKVRPDQEGRELKAILRNELRLSASLFKRLKAASAIKVNGLPVFPSFRVSSGDEISLDLAEPPADFPPEHGRLNILFEDDWLLALDKPRGMLAHPSHSRLTGTLSNFALQHILDGGGTACHAVNRLDRDTGGAVLFAKSGYVKSLMPELITRKEYLAVVCGTPDPPDGTVELPIRRAREGGMLRIVAPDGAYCRTDYETLGSGEGLSLLRLELHTGRTHQIRVHCIAIGCPVLGDKLYCTEESRLISDKYAAEFQHLHASRLVFTHPFTGSSVELRSVPTWDILPIIL